MDKEEIIRRELELLEELKDMDEDIMEGMRDRMGLRDLVMPRVPIGWYGAPGLKRYL